MNKTIKFFSLLTILISFVSCDFSNDDEVITMGELDAKYTYIKETVPGKVTLINTSQNADAYEWTFGDGSSSTAKDPVKTYAVTGEYLVTLVAKNSQTGESKSYSSTISIYIFAGGLVSNGNFESGTAPWTLGTTNAIGTSLLATANGNTYFSINVAAAGNAYDVNLSQKGISMTQGVTYRLTFDAWSDVNRSILVGIGLSGAPWTNNTVTRNLTTTSQSFSIDIPANFTSTNSRVIFDLGAAIGKVNIDNVTLNALP